MAGICIRLFGVVTPFCVGYRRQLQGTHIVVSSLGFLMARAANKWAKLLSPAIEPPDAIGFAPVQWIRRLGLCLGASQFLCIN
jgi:hypothetical protein